MRSAIWKSFLELKNKKDIFLDLEHYSSELYKWIRDNSMRFNKELLEKYRIDVLLELNNIVDYLGCDADICLDKEVERMFKDIPKTEEEFLMSIGNTLWDLLRKRTDKDCPCCLSDDLNYVLAETEKEKKIVLECNTCGWIEYLNGKEWGEGKTKIYPISNTEIQAIMQEKTNNGILRGEMC